MFQLTEYLEDKRAVIDAALDEHMPGEQTPPALLHKAMRYSVFSGGKRLRPVLCLAAAAALGKPEDKAITPAVAVELLHTYSLIHDDLPCMDNDALRRGKPTSHVVFGEANAVLAGDALQALAFEMAAAGAVGAGYAPNELVIELARAAGSRGVVGGQVADLAATESTLDEPAIEFIHLHKTADLFRAAVRMGAIAVDAKPHELAALTEYACNLGRAFQIADDLLDASTDRAREGVPRDKAATTSLAVYDHEQARHKARTFADKAVSAAEELLADRATPLVEIAEYVVNRAH